MAQTDLYYHRADRRSRAPQPVSGTWKLAYADFLTALCAFFLVMWIVHGVAAEDKTELARQFKDQAPQTDFGSETIQIAEMLRTDALMRTDAGRIRIQSEAGHVRIDLADHSEKPLFDRGKGRLNPAGETLVRRVGLVLAKFDYAIVIEGHTDAVQSLRPSYSNWELSTDRANAARRLLVEAGIHPTRIRAVTGYADTQPIRKIAPDEPNNRRISIRLLIDEQTA